MSDGVLCVWKEGARGKGRNRVKQGVEAQGKAIGTEVNGISVPYQEGNNEQEAREVKEGRLEEES